MAVYDVSNMTPRVGASMRIGSPDQVFEPGSAHTAHLHIVNPTTAMWSYTGDLYSAAFTHTYPFSAPSVGAGSTVTVNLSVTIHTTPPPGPQAVNCSISESGVEIFNEVLDNITAQSPVPPGVDASITWD